FTQGQQLPSSSLNPGQLTGMLVDSLTSQPVPFASVALLSESGTLITGQTTSESGQFSFAKLSNGNYGLKITYVGYQSRTPERHTNHR
ncbi:carboxypeptidase regulatory-like domain-containing protein, partial [Siphonobacter sp. BAB-5405]|uniref:carboxypeptidase regulatory-like domain-containing protein n=1 Tax=Siphonobacter sp. BAB-5405 TaxID=1864825 RepID=UPI001E4A2211